MFRIKVLILALFSVLSMHAQDCSKIHLVLKGETLYGIARANGCTVDQLLSANPGIGLPLQEAASVCIPRIQTPRPDVEESKSSLFHTVVLGESIYGISNKYACSIDTLYLLNPTLLETGLFSGQKIRVPIKRQEETAVPEKPRWKGLPPLPQIKLTLPFLPLLTKQSQSILKSHFLLWKGCNWPCPIGRIALQAAFP